MSSKTNLIKEYIQKCENTTSLESAKKLVEEICTVFYPEIKDIRLNLDSDNPAKAMREVFDGIPQQYDYLGDLSLLKAKLTNYLVTLESKLTSKSTSIEIINNNSNSQTITIQLANLFERINKLDLSDEEKDYIKDQLEILQGRKEDKTRAWDTCKKILKWLADKSVDIGIALIPFLSQIFS